jgi:hypothetical protein
MDWECQSSLLDTVGVCRHAATIRHVLPIGFMWNPGLTYDPSSERNTQKAVDCSIFFCGFQNLTCWAARNPKNMSYSTLNPHKGSKMNRLSTKQCLLWGVFFISGPTTDTFVVIPFLWLNIRHIFMKPPAKSSASYKPTMYAHLTWFKYVKSSSLLVKPC